VRLLERQAGRVSGSQQQAAAGSLRPAATSSSGHPGNPARQRLHLQRPTGWCVRPRVHWSAPPPAHLCSSSRPPSARAARGGLPRCRRQRWGCAGAWRWPGRGKRSRPGWRPAACAAPGAAAAPGPGRGSGCPAASWPWLRAGVGSDTGGKRSGPAAPAAAMIPATRAINQEAEVEPSLAGGIEAGAAPATSAGGRDCDRQCERHRAAAKQPSAARDTAPGCRNAACSLHDCTCCTLRTR
jgi:hypothetical protein